MSTNAELVKEELEIRDELYGKLLSVYDVKKGKPQPLTTLMSMLKEQSIYVERLKLMAYSFDYDCYKNHLENVKDIKRIDVFGYGEEKSIEDKIFFHPTITSPTTHYNLVYANDGKVYLYNEPFHKDIEDFGIDYKKEKDMEKIRLYVPELRQPSKKQLDNIEKIYDFFSA